MKKITFTYCETSATDSPAKEFTRVDGKLNKIPPSLNCLFQGEVLEVSSLRDFSDILGQATNLNVAIYGRPTKEGESFYITPSYAVEGVKSLEAANKPVIPRIREEFKYSDAAGILFLDLDDMEGDPSEAISEILEVLPELKGYDYAYQYSSSAMIYDDSGELVKGASGIHLYFAISDGKKTGEVGQILFDRLVLAGHARYKISRAGTFLKRSLIDSAVWQPERIDYVGGAKLPEGWRQDRPVYYVQGTLGKDIVPVSVFKKLSKLEEAEVAEIFADLKEATKEEQAKQRKIWIEAAATVQEREARAKFAETGNLSEDHIITLADKKTIVAKELFRNRKRFEGARCYDPIEGIEYGLCAKIFFKSDFEIIINSNAHGGVKYFLVDESNWKSKLDKDQNGTPYTSSLPNCELFLQDVARKLNLNISYNLFTQDYIINGQPVTDRDLIDLRSHLADIHRFRVKKDIIAEAIVRLAHQNEVHPIRDELESITWDGVKRLDTWLTDFADVDSNKATRAIARKFLISMVARVMQPGCKVDTTLLIYGGQGFRKSTLAATLCGNEEYFSDSMPSITHDSKEAVRHLAGKWVVELAEMASTRKADVEAIKNFLSTRIDKYRRPYATRDVAVPRQNVFIATTNDETPLSDSTGNRRYWPIHVPRKVDIDGLKEVRNQLFAEAYVAFMAGEEWWIDENSEAGKQLHAQVMTFTERDPLVDLLEAKLNDLPSNKKTAVTIADLLTLLQIPTAQAASQKKKIKAAMKQVAGWESYTSKGYEKYRKSNVLPFTKPELDFDEEAAQ